MDTLTILIITIVANVISQLLCKWLDGKDKR